MLTCTAHMESSDGCRMNSKASTTRCSNCSRSTMWRILTCLHRLTYVAIIAYLLTNMFVPSNRYNSDADYALRTIAQSWPVNSTENESAKDERSENSSEKDVAVDLRIIVLTFQRPLSLKKMLRSLTSLKTDGDRVALDIWIDRAPLVHDNATGSASHSRNGSVDMRAVYFARSFPWHHGPKRVHIQPRHAGIYGQWIDTWRPRLGPRGGEMALILEDDVDVSPFAYRWLKAVHRKYDSLPYFAGATLTSDQLSVLSPRPKVAQLAGPRTDTIFMYKCFGTWGWSPQPEQWRRFQDWFHLHKPSVNPYFHPYVEGSLPTVWYKGLEKTNRADTMWEQWFSYYMHIEQLYAVYNNLAVYTGNDKSCLCINRREVGLHFDVKGPEDLCHLLTAWNDDYVRFPADVVRLEWDGSAVGHRHY